VHRTEATTIIGNAIKTAKVAQGLMAGEATPF
jgi:hypothetical protein